VKSYCCDLIFNSFLGNEMKKNEEEGENMG
jgi:hypothetical protein